MNDTIKIPRLAIVVPCYNEEAILPRTLLQLSQYLQLLIKKNKIAADSFLYCVDDGSHDKTWEIIKTEHQHCPHTIKGLKLTKNVGHQNALLAGLISLKNKINCIVTIDADLQDDFTVIEKMLEHFQEGYDIVYGVRELRNKDSFFKRISAHCFYKLMKKSGADVIHNHADFRLISQRAVFALNQYKERNLFLRGIFPLIGYSSTQVYYTRQERLAGTTKYSLKKMIALAWDGITSFSHIPLSLIFFLGITSFGISLLMTTWVLYAKFFTSSAIPGWASIMAPLTFMGGIQLLSIGVLGEYMAKVYLEVKRRPRFIKELELK